jgi:hypothetical protein
MKKLMFLTALMVVHSFSIAQIGPSTVLTIDPDTKLADKHAPFDESFVLKIPIDSMYHENEIKNVRILKRDLAQAVLTATPVTVLSYTKTNLKTNTLQVIVPPLHPNRDYTIFIQYSPRFIIDSLEKVSELILVDNLSAARTYHNLTSRLDEFNRNIQRVLPLDLTTTMISFHNFDSLFNHDLRREFDAARASFVMADGLADDLITLRGLLNSSSLCDLVLRCCNGQPGIPVSNSALKQVSLLVCNSTQLGDAELVNISESEYSITEVLAKWPAAATAASTNRKMLQALAANIGVFESLKDLLTQSTTLAAVSRRADMIRLLGTILDKLSLRKRNFSSHYSVYLRRLDSIRDEGTALTGRPRRIFYYLGYFNFDSNGGDVKTSAGNYIIPELGLVAMATSQTFPTTAFVRPYYGVNISFRPINKNLRFSDIPNLSIWHRLSFTLGATYYSIATNHDEIDDLVSNTCALTGLNYRLGRIVRVGAGATWFRRDNPNPVLPKQVYAMPYISVSLDLDIANLISNVTSQVLK